jgi:hypothetical protein
MGFLVVMYLIFMPLAFASFFLEGVRIEFALIFASLIASGWMLAFLSGKIGIRRADRWSLWFWLFVAFSVVSLIASPYVSASYTKGIVQIAGVAAMVSASLYISRVVASDPSRLLFYVRILVLIITLVAGIGLWQSLASNLLHLNSLADFSFLARLVGSEEVWRDPGYIGSLKRTNSIASEPAHFVQILGIPGGLALLRLGLMGGSLSKSTAMIMPRWAALVIIGGFVVAISIVGYVSLALTIVSLMMVLHRSEVRYFLRYALVCVITGVGYWLLLSWLGEEFALKLETIPLIFSGATGGQVASTESLSALTVSANLSVALKNLGNNPFLGVGPGGHPLSYGELVPGWVIHAPGLYGLNQEDAASLLIRLLSETGLVGTILFLTGWLVLVVRARQAIQSALTFHVKNSLQPSPALAAAIGLTASCIALFVTFLLRSAAYFDPRLWVLMALTAAVPPLLARERQRLLEGRKIPAPRPTRRVLIRRRT